MTYQLHELPNPTGEDREAIAEPLRRYNRSKVPTLDIRPLVLALQDEQGRTVGGLWGETALDWLHIDLLAVPESMRGKDVGSALMQRAETLARERGCIGVWLDTFAFQARGFYEKLGYTVFGEIADHPAGGARYFLSKRF
ncbi:GNAT family N-acetyltransferase [Dyella sp. 20L07]|uniref:GNAT family N-acetyltransferase n=1 Tax=Dyella sp. 20L07 TaxID=3384240 RepID=UPI003D2E633B